MYKILIMENKKGINNSETVLRYYNEERELTSGFYENEEGEVIEITPENPYSAIVPFEAVTMHELEQKMIQLVKDHDANLLFPIKVVNTLYDLTLTEEDPVTNEVILPEEDENCDKSEENNPQNETEEETDVDLNINEEAEQNSEEEKNKEDM